jgi:PBP1b-binding outer membrane lipoprotein LpoB
MKKVGAVLMLAVMLFIVGCAAHTHVVGNGAQGDERTQQRQWYILFGLVPLNTVDSHVMAGSANDYTIKTEASVLDVVLNFFTSWVTVVSRTVTVTQ